MDFYGRSTISKCWQAWLTQWCRSRLSPHNEIFLVAYHSRPPHIILGLYGKINQRAHAINESILALKPMVRVIRSRKYSVPIASQNGPCLFEENIINIYLEENTVCKQLISNTTLHNYVTILAS